MGHEFLVITSTGRIFPWHQRRDGWPDTDTLRRFVRRLDYRVRPRTWAKVIWPSGVPVAYLNIRMEREIAEGNTEILPPDHRD